MYVYYYVAGLALGFSPFSLCPFFFSMELYSLNTHKQREYLLYICQQNVVFTFQNHWTILFNVAPTKNNRTDFSVDGERCAPDQSDECSVILDKIRIPQHRLKWFDGINATKPCLLLLLLLLPRSLAGQLPKYSRSTETQEPTQTMNESHFCVHIFNAHV